MPNHQQTWSVGSWLSPVSSGPESLPATTTPHALVILNQPVCSVKYLEAIWKRAAVKLCADGGANRLYDSLATDDMRLRFLPQMIKGDLDSLRSDVREFYESHGVPVILDQDLYSTDFGKCVAEIERIESESNGSVYHDIIAFGALGGRFDQTMASIHMTCKYGQQEKAQGKSKIRQIYLASNESVAVLLMPEHRHRIICDTKIEGPTCGLIPVGGTVKAITTGLMWNLDHDMPLSFGELVSTSNWFAPGEEEEKVIDIQVDAPLVWTVEVNLA